MEFAPSLDIVINETLPALQKVQCNITGSLLCKNMEVVIEFLMTFCHLNAD